MARHPGISPPAVDRTEPTATTHPVLRRNGFGFGMIAYLGGAATLLLDSITALVRSRDGHGSVSAGTARQADRLIGLSYGVVAFVHVGMGSFLAMQAYFGATFADGIGPVVGVSLIRNLAPLLVGFLLAILTAVVFTADLQGESPGRARRHEVAVRVLGVMVAGPILSAWGVLVGVGVGWLVAHKMMGISEPVFFDLFLEMLWARDIVGLVVKGVAFGGIGGVLACHEAIRPTRPGEAPGGMAAVSRSACRAAVKASLAILIFNALWFVFVYQAGPAFGPTLLMPPGR